MAITLNYITTATQTTGGSSLTFSDVSIGSASADRVVVVAICSESNVPETFSGGTIGGNSATEAVVVEGTSSTVGTIVAILYLAVPTGTTATIVSNYSGSVFRGICSVWTLTGDTPELIDIDTDTAPSGTGLSCSVDIPANAVGIAGYSQGNTFEVTWTGATERFDESVSGGSRFSTADVPAIGSDRNGHTVSVSHSNSTQTISEAVAVFTSGTPPLEEKEAATTISLELDTSGDSTKEGIASSGINLELDVSSLISKDTSTSTSLDLNISTSSIAAKAIEASTDVELEVDTSGGATKNGSGIGNFPIEVDLSGSITNKNSSIVADLDLEIDISGDAEATKISASSIDLEFDTDVLSVKSGITATDLDILLDFDSDANLKTASASTSLDVALDIDNSSSVGMRDLFVVVNHAGVVDVPLPVDADLQSIEVDSVAIRPGVSGVGI